VRLFVAINLPEAERTRLYDATADLRRSGLPVRWVARDALHLTLQFLGEVADARVAAIQSALEALAPQHAAFEMALGGLGAFPDVRSPRVIWAGIEAAPELLSLQRAVALRLANLGWEPEARPFSPHLTLGRARREARARDFAGFGQHVEAVRYAAVVNVGSVDLMRSQPGPAGARYERIVAAPLELSLTP
jgi:2'-5' RNA ligase